MEPIRTDVDDFFDGRSNDLARFEVPRGENHPSPAGDWWELDEAGKRIGALWRRTGSGAAFARWDSSPNRDRVLDLAREDPSQLKNESTRLVWGALAAIVTKDAFEDGTLIRDGAAIDWSGAAHQSYQTP
jgi:hypothetical protein